METCKICGKESHFLFESLVLSKYPVSYYQCHSCKFIQTEKPYWLEEAYSSAIGNLDIGLLHRNNIFSNSIPGILDQFSIPQDSYIDYGGGYGVFVRIMRDKGYDFYLYDKYCENLFAQFFEFENAASQKFAALTAFEVFEHLAEPIDEITKMFEFSDVIIFSTEIQPNITFSSDKDWWYFVPSGGQHIALYTVESLNHIASLLNCHLYTNRTNLHVLSKNEIMNPFEKKDNNSFGLRLVKFLERKIAPLPASPKGRESLLPTDFESVKLKLGL